MTRAEDLRAVLDDSLHAPLPGSSKRSVRVLWRALSWGFWLGYFGFVALVLTLRYGILPHIEDYRIDIEHLASRGLGQNVSIGRIEASWEGINPDLTLLDVRVADKEGRPALAFARVEAILSWWSVPSARLQLRLLRVDQPTLNLRRDGAGNLFIAGLPLNQAQSGNDVADWVLTQRRIRIRGATLVWQDELRQAPTLVLNDLNFALDNEGKNHRFGLTALPPEDFASKLDIRGDFLGTDVEQMKLWSGQAYAEINYADLAIWRQWFDYPMALPSGRGALRTWFGFANGGLHEITADVALRDVELRLAPDLPQLDLEHVSGRIGVRLLSKGFSVSGHQIELATQGSESRATIRVEPTDFQVDWLPVVDGRRGVGSASASRLDLGALAKLAEYAPLDARSRQRLNDYTPHGTVNRLRAKWTGDSEQLQTYSLQAGFDQLALKAQGNFPGFSGLSGAFEIDEKSGNATLHAGKSSVDLPGVFPVSLIELDSLNAQGKWTINKGELNAELSHLDFSSPEAAGSAQGSYRNTGNGPGNINMTAALTRGDARAVWRYMPHTVGEGARNWLHASLLAGGSSEARLVLKGNLADFPFLDKNKGQFLVTVKAHDVVLDYGKGWPRIEKIDGDLRFEGNGMLIEARQGNILGAKLTKTRVEIPDFDKPVSNLIIKGQADGPTSEFLRFIEQSPVAAQIDHFTEDMRAGGNGHLDIGLKIPLDEAKLGESKVEGNYRFANNEVTVDAALPPIRQVDGSVQFTGSDLRIPVITGVLFGGPLRISGGLQKDGKVLITATGSVNIAQLRKQVDSSLLENLSGTTAYRGEVRVNKRNADLVIDSNLLGLASSLPEPFKKTPGEVLPLRFEKILLSNGSGVSRENGADVVVRDQVSATLGKTLSMQLIRRKQAEGFVLERGSIALGRPLQLPDKGLSLGLGVSRLDLDEWRKFFQRVGSGTSANATATPSSFVPDAVSIKTPDLLVFGRHFNEVDLSASSAPTQWKIHLTSRQASGDLQWDKEGSGKLTARLKQVALEPSSAAADAVASETTKELPALDIVADDFSLGERRFGRLEVQARNESGIWRLNSIQASNPYGKLTGSGQWQIGGGKNRTQLDFKLESSDVGKLLERLGYPGTVRAGTAQLGGKIGWNSSPDDLDFSTLSGEMSLDASKGQFVKLNPGAAGRLLGLISLQGIPRRLSFDFKDVFSEGFAFDAISAKLAVQNGVMRTDRLQIDGPSARVVMRGEVDLKRETQHLNVNVQPELGGTAALGMFVVNPVAGGLTWVASKLLKNPLGQIVSVNYLVTGTWDDLKVEEISRSEAAKDAQQPAAADDKGVRHDAAK